MRELHFYTNLNNIEQASDWDLETMCMDYVSTSENIKNTDKKIVKTTQLVLLAEASEFLNNGFVIYLHNATRMIEVKDDGVLDALFSGEFGEIS